jgi:subtilisin family serine protease
MNPKSRVWSTLIAVVCALAVVLILGPPGAGATDGGSTGKAKPWGVNLSPMMRTRPYYPGEVVVKFKDGVAGPLKDRVKRLAGTSTTLKTIGPEGSDKTQLLKLDPGVQVEQAVASLRSSDEVACAEPNYIARASYTPDDPGFGSQWGLNNTGQTIHGAAGTPDADIDAPEAWDIERGLSAPTTVAVIDSGIDSSHPDLDSKVLGGYNWAGISQKSANHGWLFGYKGSVQVFAQSIKGTGRVLDHVGLVLIRFGNPSGITVSVRRSLGGGDLASFSISPSEVGALGSIIYKPLSSAVSLSSNTTYYLVFETSNANTSSFYGILDNEAGSSYDTYCDGQEHYFDGSSWVDSPAYDFFFMTNPNANPRDDCGHGTLVSGIIGAETNNATGIAGVCPGAKIMPLKALDSSGAGFISDVNAAIYYAADHGAKIINMSLGMTSYSWSLQDAINYAYDKGASVFAASGNGGNTRTNYPAGCTNVIGVGATTNRDLRADFSTYNSSVDVCAPGMYIYSTMPTYRVGLNNRGFTQDYSFASGTSVACPAAAGLGALVLSRTPSKTPDEMTQLLENYADDLGARGRDSYFGCGRINAFRAINHATEPPSKPSINRLSPSTRTIGYYIDIYGSNFADSRNSSYVTFGGMKASSYYSWSSNRIKVKVPEGISRFCSVVVHTFAGNSNPKTLKVRPRIISISPTSGNTGITVTIRGDAFGLRRYTFSCVWFASKRVSTYSHWSDTKIVVTVPSGISGTVPVRVTTSGGTSYWKYFTVTP